MLLESGYMKGALHDVVFELPLASDDDYISSASDGGAPGAFALSASSKGGDSVHRSAQGKLPIPGYGRLPQVTKTDASGTDLRVTVTVEGYRFGRFVTQDIACNGSGTETVKGTKILDEVSRVFIKSITAPAASDTLKVGFDDSWLGLPFDISSRDAIRSILKIAAGTPDANGPKVNSNLTAAMVKLESLGSGIDVKTLYSSTAIAVTDRYLMKVINNGSSRAMPRGGVLL